MTQNQTSYDLDAIIAADTDASKPITFDVAVISDADGNPVSGFRIVSRNSPQARAADRAVRIANQKAAAMRNKAIDMKTDAGAEKVIDISDGQNLARATAAVVDWFGWDKGGVPRPIDAAAMPAILKAKPTWVIEILAAQAEDNNFLPASQSNSAPMPDNS
jgi:hypothetical protein